LNKARESAKTITCSSNLRQVGVLLTMYMQSHSKQTLMGKYDPDVYDGIFPYETPGFPTSSN